MKAHWTKGSGFSRYALSLPKGVQGETPGTKGSGFSRYALSLPKGVQASATKNQEPRTRNSTPLPPRRVRRPRPTTSLFVPFVLFVVETPGSKGSGFRVQASATKNQEPRTRNSTPQPPRWVRRPRPTTYHLPIVPPPGGLAPPAGEIRAAKHRARQIRRARGMASRRHLAPASGCRNHRPWRPPIYLTGGASPPGSRTPVRSPSLFVSFVSFVVEALPVAPPPLRRVRRPRPTTYHLPPTTSLFVLFESFVVETPGSKGSGFRVQASATKNQEPRTRNSTPLPPRRVRRPRPTCLSALLPPVAYHLTPTTYHLPPPAVAPASR
jgi:hypothetical protein